MNDKEIDLLDTVLGHVRAKGLAVTLKQGQAAEPVAWVRITRDKQHMDYAIEVERQITPQTLGAVVARLKQQAKTTRKAPLLVTTYITPPIADRLTELGQQFADAAGNVYLDAPGMLVLITGRKPEKKIVAERPGRTFTTTGLKTLFALICNPELAAAPYRQIAAAADVALGALPAVMVGLEQAGHLHVMGNKRRLIATRRLLDEWNLAYARILRPKQLLRTLIAPAFETWRTWDLQADQAQWGGEPAAALLTDYLKPGVLTIYADKVPARLMVEQRMTTARVNDEHHLVEVRKPFWGKAVLTAERTDTVPPVLVYADLLATGDARCIEAGQMIYEDHLARLFTAA